MTQNVTESAGHQSSGCPAETEEGWGVAGAELVQVEGKGRQQLMFHPPPNFPGLVQLGQQPLQLVHGQKEANCLDHFSLNIGPRYILFLFKITLTCKLRSSSFRQNTRSKYMKISQTSRMKEKVETSALLNFTTKDSSLVLSKVA